MAEKGEYRSIYVAVLDDHDFQELSACARACFWVLKMRLGMAGIAPFQPETLPRYTGFPAEETTRALQELVDGRWLAIERTVYWLRNGLRHDPSEPLKSPNLVKSIQAHLRTLPKLPIANEFAAYYGLEAPFPEVVEDGEHGNPSRRVQIPPRTHEQQTEQETDTKKVVGGPAGAREPRPSEELEAIASDVIRAANRGMADNPWLSGSYRPIRPNHGSRAYVIEWLQEGIAPDVISECVTEVACSYKPDESKQIYSMAYFDAEVRRRHQESVGGTSGSNGTPADRTGDRGPTGEGRGAKKPDRYAHLVEKSA